MWMAMHIFGQLQQWRWTRRFGLNDGDLDDPRLRHLVENQYCLKSCKVNHFGHRLEQPLYLQ